MNQEEIPFEWDGKYEDNTRIKNIKGEPIPDGMYSIKAQALVGSDWFPVDTVIATTVDSVSIDAGEINLNATGIGSVSLNELKRVTQ